ncbi:hypothetical protein POM88_054329 [Heracleum sosnowskyi]|uniref:catalase n=1 Tax=Heracleum sosnowskyi TaxID=360622 RepID=A0AAD8GNC0_9APIA|nr:hypothetical protein POM88_054329 [Heracleum sosnowskyi]
MGFIFISIGPILLEDYHLVEKLANFDRERIPERVVHARGASAKGFFEVTHDISQLTCADFLRAPGVQTPVIVRFSTVIHERGSPETIRDPRGFAVKFYTREIDTCNGFYCEGFFPKKWYKPKMWTEVSKIRILIVEVPFKHRPNLVAVLTNGRAEHLILADIFGRIKSLNLMAKQDMSELGFGKEPMLEDSPDGNRI